MKRHMPKNGYQDYLAMLYSPQMWHTAPCHTKPACGDEVCAAWRKVVLELDCGNLCLNRLAGSRSYYLTNVAYLSIVAYNYTKYYEQMRPLATLALHCVTGWESLACHRHLAGSSWAMLAAWAAPVGQRWLHGRRQLGNAGCMVRLHWCLQYIICKHRHKHACNSNERSKHATRDCLCPWAWFLGGGMYIYSCQLVTR